MNPIVAGAMIGGGANIATSALQIGMAYKMSEEQMDWAKRENELAREFSEKMYKHRYQYTMDDLRQAGLNPILAAGGTPGTPGGYSMTGGQQANVAGAVRDPIEGARAGITTAREAKAFKHAVRGIKAGADKAEFDAWSAYANSEKSWTEALTAKEVLKTNRAEAKLRGAQVPMAEQTQRLYDTNYGRFLRGLDLTIKSLTGKGAAGAK